MTRAQVVIGKTYGVKVSGKVQPVRITGESVYGGWDGTNVNTNRAIRIRSAAKLRYETGPDGKPRKRCGVCANCLAVASEKPRVNESYRAAQQPEKITTGTAAEILLNWRKFCAANPCLEMSK